MASEIEKLEQARLSYEDREVFKPGDVVSWKPNLRNKTYPKDGDPAVVVGTLPTPIFDTVSEPSSFYYREPLDMKIGVFHPDGTFALLHVDSRRFTKIK